MDVTALVYAPDKSALGELRRAFATVGVSMELADDVPAILTRFQDEHFDCVVMDCESAPDDTISRLRIDPMGRAMPIFALVTDRHSMRKAYKDGATFALDKPLTSERTLRCMRAAYGLVVGERRRYYRHPLEVSVALQVSGRGEIQVSTLDISSGGFCLRLSQPLPERTTAKFQITIRELELRGSCEQVWSRADCGGFRFTHMGRVSKDALSDWLAQHMESAAAR